MLTTASGPFLGSAAITAGLVTPAHLRGPRFRRLFRGVYLDRSETVDHMTLCRAATLLLPPGAALSHRSAAHLYNAQVLARDQPVEVTAPGGLRPQPGLRVVRSPLAPGDRARRSGLPVTAPLRTAFDLARGRDLVAAVVGVDALLYQRVVRPDRLHAYVAEHAAWNGANAAVRTIGLARVFVESPLETRLRLIAVLGGLPEPEVQYDVFDRDDRLVARVDLAYPRHRLALEYDGDHHRERDTFRRDAVRLNRLHLMGWTVLRFTADDVLRHPARTLAVVRAAFHDR